MDTLQHAMTFRNVRERLRNPTGPDRSPEEVSPPPRLLAPSAYAALSRNALPRQSIGGETDSSRSRNVRIRLETKLNTLYHAMSQADPLPQKPFFALPSDLSVVQRSHVTSRDGDQATREAQPQDDSLSVRKAQPRDDTLSVRKVQPRRSSVEVSAFALATQHMTASEELGASVQACAGLHRRHIPNEAPSHVPNTCHLMHPHPDPCDSACAAQPMIVASLSPSLHLRVSTRCRVSGSFFACRVACPSAGARQPGT